VNTITVKVCELVPPDVSALSVLTPAYCRTSTVTACYLLEVIDSGLTNLIHWPSVVVVLCSHSRLWALVRVYFTFEKSPVEVHCAAVSTCIVGVRGGCRLRARRIIVCVLFCRQVSLMALLWRMARILKYLC